VTVRRRVPPTLAPVPWEALRTELGVVEAFPPEALADATAAARAPRLPELDRTDLELRTLDPPGSRDLDQAYALERRGHGYRVSYAIADVAAFVTPGGAMDQESHRRAETLYGPDRRVPMLPLLLSEGAASLLPGQRRPALLWTLDLDADGELFATRVERAVVRSRVQLDYRTVHDPLLEEIGTKRRALALARGAVQLPSLEQTVALDPAGRPILVYRASEPSESWNAELSLLTGMAAAGLMLDGGIGVLRTLPPPLPEDVAQLRRSALALGIDWPDDRAYPEVVAALDPHRGADAALLALVPRLLRGAGYVAFAGAPPAQPRHSAVAAPYAHCTAPLRRLVDRYAGEICVALCDGAPVPPWARDALALLPEEMAAGDRRAHELDRATVDLAEAVVLAPRTGEVLVGTVVSAEDGKGVIQLAEPAVRATIIGTDLRPGQSVRARLVTADPRARKVRFEQESGGSPS
jgi:exoribonuclease R